MPTIRCNRVFDSSHAIFHLGVEGQNDRREIF